jgi:hypothetical protein
MLPGHGHPHLSELVAVYAPLPYTDRPSASNVHHEGLEAMAHYRFTSGVFDEGPGEEDRRSALPAKDDEDKVDVEDRRPQPSTG